MCLVSRKHKQLINKIKFKWKFSVTISLEQAHWCEFAENFGNGPARASKAVPLPSVRHDRWNFLVSHDRYHSAAGQRMLLLGVPLRICRVLVLKEEVGKQSHSCFSDRGRAGGASGELLKMEAGPHRALC